MPSDTRMPVKVIVTTTINKPTKAIEKFIDIAKRNGWIIVVAGDLKTPHEDYFALQEKYEPGFFTYLSPEEQEQKFPALSRLIGWNCIQRRNFGLIFAKHVGADVVAVVDDDNIPDDYWGRGLLVGQRAAVDGYYTDEPVFDPLARFDHGVWHRGFPIQLLPNRQNIKKGDEITTKWLVQAELWNGAPDIDAVARIAFNDPQVQYSHDRPFAGDKVAPFNSQNTFIDGSVLKDYFLFPHIGRMDDIWAAYYLQSIYGFCVCFGRASVTQERNPHDFSKDLEAELIGYRHSLDFINDLFTGGEWQKHLPEQAITAFKEYQRIMEKDWELGAE
jgi:hypothetical protein